MHSQAQHDNGEKLIVQPEIDYGAWSPVDVIDVPVDVKINKARSIQSSPGDAAENSNFNRQRKVGVKVAARRNFESTSNAENPTTLRPAYKRRTFPSATSTSTTAKTSDTSVKAKYTRKLNENPSTTFKPRRQFTPRAKAENVIATTTPLTPSSTTSRIVFKKPTRGNYRPKSATKNGANDDGILTGGGGADEENYPEHFKTLLKNKEVAAPTHESEKSVLKKPSKPFRPLPEKTTKTPAAIKAKPNAALYAPRQQHRLKITSPVPTEETSSTIESTTSRRATLRTRPSYRPTERTRASTLQEPPTAKSTRAPNLNQIVVEESMNVNTQITDDAIKQIDAPSDEPYFPRTSAVS